MADADLVNTPPRPLAHRLSAAVFATINLAIKLHLSTRSPAERSDRSSRQPRLRVGSYAIAGLTQVCGVVASIGFNAYLALCLEPDKFGEFVIATAVALLASSLGNGGYDTLTIRWVARLADSSDRRSLERYLTYARRKSVWRSAVLGFGVMVVGVAANWFGWINSATPLLIAAIRAPAISHQRINESALRGCGSTFWGLASLWLTPSLALLLIAVSPGGELSSTTALLAHFAATIVTAAVSRSVLRTRAPLSKPVAVLSPSTRERREWNAEAAPLALLTITMAAQSQGTPLLVAMLLGSEGAGLYGIAYRIALPLQMVAEAVALVVSPRIAAAHAQGNYQLIQTHLCQAVWIAFPATAVLAAGLGVNAESVLRRFGPAYAEAATALQILTLGYAVQSACGPTGQTLNSTGHGWVSLRAIGAALATSLVLTSTLTPWAGAAGPAIGASFGLAMWSVWLAIEVRRLIGVNSTILQWPASSPAKAAPATSSDLASRAA